MRRLFSFLFICLLFGASSAGAQDPAIEELKNQIEALKQDYETRIKELEQKVELLQIQAPDVTETPPLEQPQQQTFP